MAKGSNDVILRDRLQFDINSQGDTALVYGRIDLSDYVSIPENKGLAIKEIRFMLRTRQENDDGVFPNVLTTTNLSLVPDGGLYSSVKIFATTTAYEQITDVGIGSPNVLCVFEKQTTLMQTDGAAGSGPGAVLDTYEHMFGTPDLHPEGFDVVTDLLIGIGLENCSNGALTDTTAELDVMIIAEPKKITSKDLTQMLSQAQDL
jgi:hypothetical protein